MLAALQIAPRAPTASAKNLPPSRAPGERGKTIKGVRMIDEDVPISLAEIERDLQGTRKAEARVEAFFARGAGPARVRTRGGTATEPPDVAQGVGRRLIARCPADTQKRYRTLLRVEAGMIDDDDYGTLIAPGCYLPEGEVRRLLTDPARVVAADLVAALAKHCGPQPAEVLRRWQQGTAPATLGVMSLILLALRKGLAAGRPPLTRF